MLGFASRAPRFSSISFAPRLAQLVSDDPVRLDAKRVPVGNGKEITSNALPYKALRDAAVLRIREAILQGKLKPGQRILEVEMAKELGISRAPVREAIRQLESEGLVVSRSHRGTYVTTLFSQDATEIFSLRAALEGLAIMLVAQSRNAEVLDQLDQSVDEMQACVEANDMEGVVQADFRFHEILCRAANHQRLLDIWSSMSVQIRALLSITDLQYLKPSEVVPRHRTLLEAMRASEAERAMWLLINDILKAGEYAAARLAASP
jgi:DNA-binding GntR family transcriptional regulator